MIAIYQMIHSIDFEMIDVNEDDLFNLKALEHMMSIDEDYDRDDSDVDGHIGSNDEYVGVEDNVESGREKLNEELLNDNDDDGDDDDDSDDDGDDGDDDGKGKKQSKRQKVQDPGNHSQNFINALFLL